MRSMWKLSLMAVVTLSAFGCGGTEVDAPEQHAPGEVRQQGLALGCEVNSDGVQTGRCTDLNRCVIVAHYSCEAGLHTGGFAYCGAYANSNPCDLP